MIKRRFFKVDHGDRDGADHSSSSSDEDYDNQPAEGSQENDDDNEVSSASSGSFIHFFFSFSKSILVDVLALLHGVLNSLNFVAWFNYLRRV